MNPCRHAAVWTRLNSWPVRCKACNENTLALLQFINEEPALRIPYDLKVRVDHDIQSGFVIRAHGVRGDELNSVVLTWLTERRTEHRSLKRSKRSVFLDSPDLKKPMRSKHGELQAIISAGPSYILHTGAPGDITGTNMYAVDTCTQEHRHCNLVMYNSYMPPWFGVFPVRSGRSPPARFNPLRYVTSARRGRTRPAPTANAACLMGFRTRAANVGGLESLRQSRTER